MDDEHPALLRRAAAAASPPAIGAVLRRLVRRSARDLDRAAAARARQRLGAGARHRGARDVAGDDAPLRSRAGSAAPRASRAGICVLLGLTPAQGVAYGLVRAGARVVWAVPGLVVILARTLRPGESARRRARRRSSPAGRRARDGGSRLRCAPCCSTSAGRSTPTASPGRSGSAGSGRTETRRRRERFDRAFYAADDALVGAIPRDLSFAETVERLSAGVAERLGRADAASDARARFLGTPAPISRATPRSLARPPRRFRLGDRLELLRKPRGRLPRDGPRAAPRRRRRLGRRRARRSPTGGSSTRRSRPWASRRGERCSSATRSPATWRARAALGMRHVWVRSESRRAEACCPGDPVIAA